MKQVGRAKIMWNMIIATIICLCMCSSAIMLMTSSSQWDGAPEIQAKVTSDPVCTTTKTKKSTKTKCDMDISYIVDKKDYIKKIQTSSLKSKGDMIDIQYLESDPGTMRQKQIPGKYVGSGLSACATCIFLLAGSYSYFAYNNDAVSTMTGVSSTASMLSR